MRRWEPETAGRVLMQRLTDQGLPARLYTGDDGNPRVHAAPARVPTAGTEITVVAARGACAFVSEWGAVVGDTRQLGAVVAYVLWLFGRARR